LFVHDLPCAQLIKTLRREDAYRSRSKISLPWHYMEMSGQLYASAALAPWQTAPGILWMGGWVDPKGSLDHMEKFLTLLGLELRPLGHPARRLSRYSGSRLPLI
jgi:hypothetical protein